MRAVAKWKAEMVEALGGEAMISPQRRTLLDLAARTKLFVDHADAYLLNQPTLINRRKKSFIPLIEQRQRIADRLQQQLVVLGLDKVERDGGMLPPEWVEKVQPHAIELEDHHQDDVAPADASGGES